ncbi:uncharacterized protein LOC101847234 [Aplysia californica]|uniref:Uncharacterized protein LOC101847234 n=1 Tax=Aplysia californica TaxID=6500 RepID=A0ABM0K9B3_APLCA|nr:uncharacterized protein LOC101847234 [Aplysia californica]
MSGAAGGTTVDHADSSHQVLALDSLGNSHKVLQSREYDTAGWTFEQEKWPLLNLTILPILAVLIFLVCVALKMYKWYRDGSKLKARGDVEFGDESEVNYGIITAGDKHFCQIDIRSDTTSVYDTVNSFRYMGNGAAIQPGPHPYQDTVTSYKSLLLQRADGSQYDSVKSYKAFLQRVTQNKDLAVEVKLLENYPIRSKSAEHCFVVEEESSERSGDVATKLLNFLPLKKQLHTEGKISELERKKQRCRRASTDLPPAMRKRSASNPTCRRAVARGAASLPSVHYAVSSDSDEETQQSFQSDRRRKWAERKKMYRSTSAGKISKDISHMVCADDVVGVGKRRRHFSADSARRPGKTWYVHKKGTTAMAKKARETPPNDHQVGGRPECKVKVTTDRRGEESSSENPHSSPSSCEVEAMSDAVVSDSEEDTRLNTILSTASDKTLDNDVFFSLDSGAELGSSTELLQHSPLRLSQVSPAAIPPCIDEEQDLRNLDELGPVGSSPETLPIPRLLYHPSSSSNQNCRNVVSSKQVFVENNHQAIPTISSDFCHSNSTVGDASKKPHDDPVSTHPQSSSTLAADCHKPSDVHNKGADLSKDGLEKAAAAAAGGGKAGVSATGKVQSPQRVQRFHVTFVNADSSTLQSE